MHLHLMNRRKYLHRTHKYRSTDRRTHPMLATSNSNKSPQRNGRKKAKEGERQGLNWGEGKKDEKVRVESKLIKGVERKESGRSKEKEHQQQQK